MCVVTLVWVLIKVWSFLNAWLNNKKRMLQYARTQPRSSCSDCDLVVNPNVQWKHIGPMRINIIGGCLVGWPAVNHCLQYGFLLWWTYISPPSLLYWMACLVYAWWASTIIEPMQVFRCLASLSPSLGNRCNSIRQVWLFWVMFTPLVGLTIINIYKICPEAAWG